MTKQVMFVGKHNATYEGYQFHNGIFQTSDPKKIKRLRTSFFYGNELKEVDPGEHDGQKPLEEMTVAELKPMVIDQDWLKTEKPRKDEIIAKIREEALEG